jgi:hypothetical protein
MQGRALSQSGRYTECTPCIALQCVASHRMAQANLLAAASTALHGKPLLKARPTPSELRTDVRTMLERDAGYSIASSGARRGAPVALQSFCPIWQTS